MSGFKRLSKDHYGALLLLVIGAGVLALGLSYKMGSLNRMGAGFIPVVLGVLMMLVGLAIGVTAEPAGSREMTDPLPGHGAHGSGIDVRGWSCILGGVVAFVVLGAYAGLVIATFGAAFISALGDRESTVKSAIVLSTILTLFCVIVFHYGLSLQLPLFHWG